MGHPTEESNGKRKWSPWAAVPLLLAGAFLHALYVKGTGAQCAGLRSASSGGSRSHPSSGGGGSEQQSGDDAAAGPVSAEAAAVAEAQARQKAAASSLSELDKMFAARGAVRLLPGDSGKCWFHGQKAYAIDREMFKRMGGSVGACQDSPATGLPGFSEALLCECTAPTDAAAFQRSFLEVGALDGHSLSNLLFFETQLGWRGLCVEGSPVNYALLKVHRPHCVTVNSVLGDNAGEKREATFYSFVKPGSWEAAMSCMEGSGSYCATADVAAKYAASIGATLRKDTVPLLRLAPMFAALRFKRMGWVMLDVEGAEDLVAATIDFAAVEPRYVTLEDNAASPATRTEARLRELGYTMQGIVGGDRLYEKPAA